jgi:hypothetical protein|tara:strand:+ start:9459 stop:9752 length:294 start_codon:yes stop_codon:yes gene_type:complete
MPAMFGKKLQARREEAFKQAWSQEPKYVELREKERQAWIKRETAKRDRDDKQVKKSLAAYDKAMELRNKRWRDYFSKLAKSEMKKLRKKNRSFKARR